MSTLKLWSINFGVDVLRYIRFSTNGYLMNFVNAKHNFCCIVFLRLQKNKAIADCCSRFRKKNENIVRNFKQNETQIKQI